MNDSNPDGTSDASAPALSDPDLQPVVTHETIEIPIRKRSRLWTWAKWLFGAGATVGTLVLIAVVIWVVRVTKDLPTLEAVKEYKPPVMTRVHAGDGKVITEYSKEARVFVPIESIPRPLQHGFVAAEDQRFYSHGGWDPIGLIRATLQAPLRRARGQRIGGTSTLTQQVAKNFLTGDDYSIRRKVREIAIARKVEAAFSKDEIMELYLNEIYFGRGAYGVAAASLKHFGKPMDQLSLAEMTYLAAVPKGPNNYRLDTENGFRRAKARQAYILGRMVEDGYINQDEADAAKAETLNWVKRLEGKQYLASEYFNEEVRKIVFDSYGEDELYEGGLSIRTSLDTDMQLAARKALREGLEGYDRRHGYRGPIGKIGVSDWETELAEFTAPDDIGEWQTAVILSASTSEGSIGMLEAPEETGIDPDTGEALEGDVQPVRGTIKLADMTWAGPALKNGKVGPKPASVSAMFKPGDVILVEAVDDSFVLRQVPAVNGAIMAMDPHTGRVLALVGGYSFQQSEFNRATQAYRQPGSSFKPFVYAAAMENGYTPASQVLDAPFIIEAPDTADGYYKPSNYSEGKWYGLSTLRLGLEKSRNAMTVRLANDMGMSAVENIGKRFGIYDKVPLELAWSLGAGETTLFRLSNAYSQMINGGKKVTPSIIDRVQDGTGKTIFRHPKECVECYQDEWTGQSPPDLLDDREQIIDPVSAYQTMFMMQGVVTNGTGRTIAELGRPLGGKTGTTNDYKDAWFMGFGPDLVAGVYVGFDTPETMGREAGGVVAAPIFKAFMKDALEGAPLVPFRIPEGVSLAPVNRNTGEPSFIGAEDYILEAFKPGTEPQIGGVSGTGTSTDFGSGSFGFGSYETPLGSEGEDSAPQDDTPMDFGAAPDKPLAGRDDDAQSPSASVDFGAGPSDDALDDILDTAAGSLETPPSEEPLENLDDGLY